MKRKLLLFGGAGLVGSRMQQLLSKRFLIIAPGKKDVDVTRKSALENTVRDVLPDSIIYAAGITRPDEAETNKQLAFTVNAVSSGLLAEIANKQNIPLLYLSTDAVFSGRKKESPYRESDPTSPVNYYGFTKREGEKYVLRASKSNAVLRLITVYSHSYPKKLDVVRRALESWQKKEIFPGVVDQYFNPTYVDDAVEAIALIIEKNIQGILHFGAKNSLSNFAFLEQLAVSGGFDQGLVKKVTFKEHYKNAVAKRGQFSRLSTKKAEKLFGKVAVRPISESLASFWKNYPKNG